MQPSRTAASVGAAIVPHKPNVTAIDAPDELHEKTRQLIERNALACAAFALEPIPFVDTLLILPGQLRMVVAIAKLHGYDFTPQNAKTLALELGGTLLYGIASRHVVRGALKVVAPFVGGVLAAPMVFASTFTLGHLAERHFRAKRGDLPVLDAGAQKEWLGRLLQEGKAAFGRLSPQDLARLLLHLKTRVRR